MKLTSARSMKKILNTNSFAFILLAMFSYQANADINFYGKINVSLEDVDSKTSDETEFKNNASRVGVKGSYDLSSGLKLSFQIEEEIDPTDLRADGDKVFKERNTFVAASGDFGKLYAGTHDTVFKQSQLKIDLFNDTRADIKYILRGENRMDSFIGYTSPDLIDGLNLTVNSIRQSSGNGESMALRYSKNNVKAAFAIDQNIKGYDGERFSIMVPVGEVDLGLLYQSSKKLSSSKSFSGHVISMKKKISNKGSIYIQNARSDMRILSGKQNSIGYTYNINKSTKAFVHYSKLNGEGETTLISAGAEYKF
ncbi:MAG: porin [SAR86 cluster bacterium]|nr:porin [SAR86 cluster bacterium]